MAATEFLFVYGTLHPDSAPAEIAPAVRQLERVGEGTMQGRVEQMRDYPAATRSLKSKSKVKGTVFKLPDDPDVLRQLDQYEEYKPEDRASSLFVREQTPIALNDGKRLRCWVYLYNRPLAA